MPTTHFLRATNSAGDHFWYTGRAGPGWVAANRAEAFPVTLEGGRERALRFNTYWHLHGLTFIPVEA